MTLFGLMVFNVGLTYGLIQLGAQCGSSVAPLATNMGTLGLFITCVFAFFLGLGATLAEPALAALGTSVERLSHGRFRAQGLVLSVGCLMWASPMVSSRSWCSLSGSGSGQGS